MDYLEKIEHGRAFIYKNNIYVRADHIYRKLYREDMIPCSEIGIFDHERKISFHAVPTDLIHIHITENVIKLVVSY